ncbi:transcriptional repressor LexA [candidate division KSB1 bacterium]|nr:transcriptional repressor LexA [candidate division KSB1 bacterium]
MKSEVNKLTKTQQNVLRGIKNFVMERGYPPTIREIMDLFGYASVNNVQRILSVLERKGYISRKHRGNARSIEILSDDIESKSVIKTIPVLGKIAAGTPILAQENIEGYISVDLSYIGARGDFALTVKGDSMTGANIFDNDLIIIREMKQPKNNDIIVALLDEEATVKRFVSESNQIKLMPENPNYQPIIINKNDLYFRVLGKVEAVIHRI